MSESAGREQDSQPSSRGVALPARVGVGLHDHITQSERPVATSLPRAGLVQASAALTRPPAIDPPSLGAIAASGVASASGRLPHHDTIQTAFGHHDLSQVAVARDAAARRSSAQLGARAYTFGERIAMPSADLRVEAHEAAHVIQQRAGRVDRHGRPGDAHERDADAVADRVVRGESAVGLLDALSGGARAGQAPAQVQCFTTTVANAGGAWGYALTPEANNPSAEKRAADEAYRALVVALGLYEAGATIATTDAVLAAARRFSSEFEAVAKPDEAFPGAKRIRTNAAKLINEAQADLYTRLESVVTTPTPNTTPSQRVDQAVGQLRNDAEHRRAHKRLLKYRQKLGATATYVANVADTDGPAIIQSWRARGDMYHVGAVLNLFPQLKVILYDLPAPGQLATTRDFDREFDYAQRWEQASMIADYYGQANRVFYTHADGVAARSSKGAAYDFHAAAAAQQAPATMQRMFIDVGGCTTILGLDMMAARQDDTYDTRRAELAQAVAPAPQANDGRADAAEIQHYLAAHGWDMATKYVIINFRDSGHAHIQKKLAAVPQPDRQAVAAAYDPIKDQVGGNHPDLDTGTVGVDQLATLVRARGFTPVFMGEEPAHVPEPHLIRYWSFRHDYNQAANLQLCRGGRAAEAYFIRVVAETYDVRLLSMRSGVTDQLAFLGIPTISIDIDNFHQAAVPELAEDPGYLLGDDETAHSWARGSKLEAGLERDYGRVFLAKSRPLDEFDLATAKWKGTIKDEDLDVIGKAMDFYFGTDVEDADASLGVRDASHPFHPAKMAATKLINREALAHAASGKIDTGLNPEVVVAHIRALLGPEQVSKQVLAQAHQFARLHLEFIESGSTPVVAKDIQHRVAKLTQRCAFLDAIIPLFEPHREQGRYEDERELIERLAATNGSPRTKLERALALLVQSKDIRGLDHKDHKVSKYFDVIDAVDLDAIDAALKQAKAAASVERPVVHALRLAPIHELVEAAHAALSGAVAGAIKAHGADTYYGRWFVPARDKLAAVSID